MRGPKKRRSSCAWYPLATYFLWCLGSAFSLGLRLRGKKCSEVWFSLRNQSRFSSSSSSAPNLYAETNQFCSTDCVKNLAFAFCLSAVYELTLHRDQPFQRSGVHFMKRFDTMLPLLISILIGVAVAQVR